MGAVITVIILLLALCSVVVNCCPILTSNVNGSCCDIQEKQIFKFTTYVSKSRVYNISNFCGNCQHWADGYCDAVSGGGGWLVIQRRIKKYSTDFHNVTCLALLL